MLKKIFIFITLIGICPAYATAKSFDSLWPREKLECAKKVIEKVLKEKEFKEAEDIAGTCGDIALLDFIKLQESLESNSEELDYYNLKELSSYLANYPNHKALELQTMRAIKDPFELADAYKNSSANWGNDESIYSIIANILLAQEISEFRVEHLDEIIKKTWIYANLSSSKLENLYKKYSDFIGEEGVKQKISLLLSKQHYKTANTLLDYTDKEYQKYYQIRQKFRSDNKNALSYLKEVPKAYHFDEGLFYDIVWWFQRRDEQNKIAKYIVALPDNLVNPEAWYKIRVLNSRYLLDTKDYEKAYDVVAKHETREGSIEYAELEWLSGWIALEYMHKPNIALYHFRNIDKNVSYPISKARAAYWLGRSYKALDNQESAKIYFEKGSLYVTTFYGQMSLMELNDNFTIKLPELILPNSKKMINVLTKDKLSRLGLYLGYAGYKSEMKTYLQKAIQNNSNQDFVSSVIALAEYQEDYVLANSLAKHATKFNIVTASNYPVVKQVVNMQSKEKALLHALIKQESGFHQGAVSSAGALGFMQLMPATAKEVAHKLKMVYSKKKLLHDAEYNIKLGSYYVNYLMKKFDGSYVLAVASYNAGPSSTQKWIKQNGDPREFSNLYQVINWIELISFPETRNYVQRILENAVIYMHVFQS